MYTVRDYRDALEDRDSYEMNSDKWDMAQKKVVSIIAAMVANGNRWMVEEVMDEVYSLNDCGLSLSDAAVQYDLWLLKSNGYEKEAARLMDLGWE